MAVMPLVPEHKRWRTVSKLISLGNLLVRKVTWFVVLHNYVCNFDFVPRIWNLLHDKDWLNILSSSKCSLSYIETYRGQHTLPFLHFDFQQSTPGKCIYSATFFFLVWPFRLDFFQPRTQPQKFRQTPKETNN